MLPVLPAVFPISGVIANELAPAISHERVVVSPSFMRLGCAWKDIISSVDAGNGLTCDDGLAEVERLSEGEGTHPTEQELKRTAMASNVVKASGNKPGLFRAVIILNATVPHTVNNVL
jgi:hypothetical protein